MQERVPPSYQQTASDEVDIRAVFAAIGRFFNRVGRGFIMFLIKLRQATKKYSWLILICMLIGAAIGLLGYLTYRPYYASELTLSSRYYTNEMLSSAIEELDRLAEENSYEILARKLNLNPSQAAAIRTLSIESIATTTDVVEVEALLQVISSNEELTPEQEEFLRERLTANSTTFKVIATAYDLSILDPLEQGMVTFLKDNDYIRRRVAIDQENLLTLRDKLRKDQDQLNQLKSLQAEAYRRLAETGQSGSNNVIFGTPETTNAPLNVYVQDLEFARELIKTNKRLELNHGLEIVSGFTPYGAPASLSMRDQLIVGALLGMLTAYLIIILIGINQALNRFEARYASKKVNA